MPGLRFSSLSSGSKGNCLVAESGDTRLLIDCGLSAREATRRLARRGLDAGQIDAICVTHEHDDHSGGVFSLAAQTGATVYLTRGTLRALTADAAVPDGVAVHLIDGRSPLSIGALEVRPFTVPHDAREPVQFVVGDGRARLGVLTDLGASTPHVVEMLSGCEALVLECNHDLERLRNGRYPQWLKERISGPLGHLDNADAAGLLGQLDRSRLQHLVAAHLSEHNNSPALAQQALAAVLNCAPQEIECANQLDGFGWRSI